MSRLLLAIVCVVLAVSVLTGCTVTEDVGARKRRISQVNDLQMRMLTEDWDYFWLYERNTSLTQWHPRVGF